MWRPTTTSCRCGGEGGGVIVQVDAGGEGRVMVGWEEVGRPLLDRTPRSHRPRPPVYLTPSPPPLQVQLTADYAPAKLMELLTASQFYPLEAALSICQRRGMVSEQVRRREGEGQGRGSFLPPEPPSLRSPATWIGMVSEQGRLHPPCQWSRSRCTF